MHKTYMFEYLNEAEFKKRERSVKKYNMFAFKKSNRMVQIICFKRD